MLCTRRAAVADTHLISSHVNDTVRCCTGCKARRRLITCGPTVDALSPAAQRPPALARTLAALSAAAILSISMTGPCHANELFQKTCAGCHAGGGNVVQAGATLKTGDLQKNGMLDPEALYNLIYKGKGKMPGYGINCAPRGQCTFAARLSDDEIRGLASYTLEQAAAGWQ